MYVEVDGGVNGRQLRIGETKLQRKRSLLGAELRRVERNVAELVQNEEDWPDLPAKCNTNRNGHAPKGVGDEVGKSIALGLARVPKSYRIGRLLVQVVRNVVDANCTLAASVRLQDVEKHLEVDNGNVLGGERAVLETVLGAAALLDEPGALFMRALNQAVWVVDDELIVACFFVHTGANGVKGSLQGKAESRVRHGGRQGGDESK